MPFVGNIYSRFSRMKRVHILTAMAIDCVVLRNRFLLRTRKAVYECIIVMRVHLNEQNNNITIETIGFDFHQKPGVGRQLRTRKIIQAWLSPWVEAVFHLLKLVLKYRLIVIFSPLLWLVMSNLKKCVSPCSSVSWKLTLYTFTYLSRDLWETAGCFEFTSLHSKVEHNTWKKRKK